MLPLSRCQPLFRYFDASRYGAIAELLPLITPLSSFIAVFAFFARRLIFAAFAATTPRRCIFRLFRRRRHAFLPRVAFTALTICRFDFRHATPCSCCWRYVSLLSLRAMLMSR